jgi:hypothetical protein
MPFFVLLLFIIVIGLWVRSSRLKSRLEELEHQMERLRLEKRLARPDLQPQPQPQPEVRTEPLPPPVIIPPPPPPPPPVHVPVLADRLRESLQTPPERAAPPPPPMPEPQPAAAPAFSLADTLRERLSGEEWEALVGGSLLNELGSLILVIAIALGLTYSATHMGPAGRVVLALGISFSMLTGGVILERRQKYLVFARGLLGGGWAALYLTAYGMHALAAARVIESPLLGAIVLIAVAAGMILHSLRYNSQTVTGLAYFAAFAALAVTPVAAFSVIALVPLGASLLYIAWRFEWFAMALFGLIATYGTCATKATGTATVAETQSILGIYWLLFEAFDLLRAAKRKPAAGAVAWIGPLNAAAALGFSYLKWSSTLDAQLWIFFAGAAAVYLADAILRSRLRPPSKVPADNLAERALSGYEGAITLAAALAIPAIFLGLSGFRVSAALLAEAEILFVGGLVSGQDYLRHLAGGAFLISLGKLAAVDIPQPGHTWTPVALVSAGLFYVNRALHRLTREYSYTAALLLLAVLGFVVPPVYLGIAWLGLALALFQFGFWMKLWEFRLQSYMIAVLGFGVLLTLNAFVPDAHPWQTLLTTALGLWLTTAQVMIIHRLDDVEHSWVRDVCSAGGTFMAGALLWQVVPRGFLGLAWFALAILCLETGLAVKVKWFRTQGDIAGALGLATLAAINVLGAGGVPPHQWISLGAAAILAYAVSARTYRLPEAEHRKRRDVTISAGNAWLAALCWYALPNPLIAVAWGVMALLLLELGAALPWSAARANGHVLAACGFARLFAANFTISGRSLGISHRLLTVLPYAALCYYLHDLTARARDRASRLYLYAGAILIVFLAQFELGRSMVVVGWAIFGAILLFCGLRLDKPDLRWQSYALALVTFVRAWTTNFYIPESLLGMPVRVLTAAVVIAAFYLNEFLSPRGQKIGERVSPRAMFSILATALLTALLFYEVSGSLLTVAWGLEGIGLLLAGFSLRERSLRLAGLALFFFCIPKLFFYDLRQLDTPYRILSFFVLGLILLGASWVYTRFREQLKQYL